MCERNGEVRPEYKLLRRESEVFIGQASLFGVKVQNAKLWPRLAFNLGLNCRGRPSRTTPLQQATTVDLAPLWLAVSRGQSLCGVTSRVEMASVSALALVESRLNEGGGMSEATKARVTALIQRERGKRTWRPSEVLTRLSAQMLARVVKHRGLELLVNDETSSLAVKVVNTRRYLEAGELPEQYFRQAHDEMVELIDAISEGDIAVQSSDGVATVVSYLNHVLDLGFSRAPVVVACNPAFRFGGMAVRKYTVAQWRDGYCDLEAVWTFLNQLEPGWGGTKTVGGSPQGRDSRLDLETVEGVVRTFCYHNWWQRAWDRLAGKR